MELTTRLIPAKDCYVALPQHIVQVLARGGYPPVPLVLEVESLSGPAPKPGSSGAGADRQLWHLAWMGTVAKDQELEVPEALARCLQLPAGIRVQMRVLNARDVPAATSVSVEPASRDDWELLELNQGHLEESILSQVALVRRGQAVPIWVRRQACIRLRVVATAPQPLVRLVPGAELLVAPPQAGQRRGREGQEGLAAAGPLAPGGPSRGNQQGSAASQPGRAANALLAEPVWLRVQELHPSLAPALEGWGTLGVRALPTCSVYVAAATAQRAGLEEYQLLTVTATAQSSQEKASQQQAVGGRSGGREQAGSGENQAGQQQGRDLEVEDGPSSRSPRSAQLQPQPLPLLVQLRLCEAVAPAHVMLAPVLRLRVGTHLQGRVRLQASHQQPQGPPACLYLSPLQFRPGQSSSRTAGRRGGAAREGKGLTWHLHKQLLSVSGSRARSIPPLTDLNRPPKAPAEGSLVAQAGAAAALLHCWLLTQASSAGRGAGRGAQAPVLDKTVLHMRVARRARGRQGAAGEAPTLKPCDAFFMLSFGSPQEQEGSEASQPPVPFLGPPRSAEQAMGTAGEEQGGAVPIQQLLEAVGAGEVQVRMAGAILGRLVGAVAKDSFWGRPAPPVPPSWLEPVACLARARLRSLLARGAQQERARRGLVPPGGVLLCGAEASGKSQLAQALAEELHYDEGCLAYPLLLRCTELVGEPESAVKAALQSALDEGRRHAPAVVVLDDLDALLPAPGDAEPPAGGGSRVEFVADLLDAAQRASGPPVAFLAVARSAAAIPAELQQSGRLDLSVDLPAPAEAERSAILSRALAGRCLRCSGALVAAVARRCQGFDTADVEVLVDRAVHAAAGRFLLQAGASAARGKAGSGQGGGVGVHPPSAEALLGGGEGKNGKLQRGALAELEAGGARGETSPAAQAGGLARTRDREEGLPMEARRRVGSPATKGQLKLQEADFSQALEGFVPAAMRGIAQAAGSTAGERRGWEDVGGLKEVCRALEEILEMPAKHAPLFAGAPLRLRSGVLLYGPPGCGKTHVVGAAAAACNLRCISVKGPELLNKYIGASEQAVRDVFRKASAAAPCILFFDEFDAIAPKRGHDNTGVTDRVVNQLLTELDGVEGLTGVFVLAATSRPDLIDAALLRPGRLDRLLLCDFPSAEERAEILHSLAQHLPGVQDMDWKAVAAQLEGFSGADLQALLAEAQLAAVHAVLDLSGSKADAAPLQPRVCWEGLQSAADKARPSVPHSERARLATIYDNFLSSKSATATQESKGKRATLA